MTGSEELKEVAWPIALEVVCPGIEEFPYTIGVEELCRKVAIPTALEVD